MLLLLIANTDCSYLETDISFSSTFVNVAIADMARDTNRLLIDQKPRQPYRYSYRQPSLSELIANVAKDSNETALMPHRQGKVTSWSFTRLHNQN